MLNISSGAIRRFTYCPRWYFINYILGFHPKSKMKAKVPIGDAIHKSLTERTKANFKSRIDDLIRSEDIAEEDVAFDELVARGEILLDQALTWLGKFDGLVLQEKLVQCVIKLNEDEATLSGYPDLVAQKSGENILYDYKIGYDAISEAEAFSYAYPFTLHKLGLVAAGVQINKAMVASMIIRTRKERYSARTKTPLVDIIELPVYISGQIENMLKQVVESIAFCTKTGIFPALGITNGVCIWCPNGREIKGQKLCLYPDNVLKEFSQTSLQRASIEKWRDEL
jgi:hypothetical protein